MTQETLKILLVDDDKFLLEMYASKFKTMGYNISTAVGSEDALNKLRGGDTPDVLVLDIIMPQMDGLELLETIRKESLVPNAKVVMLTNETDPAKIEKAKSLGIVGYIVKATLIPSEVVDEVASLVKK
jgi:CheY-like chemotaxis protein